MATIDRAEAFGAGAAWRKIIIAAVGLLMLALITGIVGLWRHATANQSARLADEAGARAALLSAIVDHQTEPLYILDRGMRLEFTNRQAAESMGSNPDQLRHKELGSVFGPWDAMALQDAATRAIDQQTTITVDLQRGKATNRRSIHARFVPLAHIPVAGLPEPTPGVLVVEQDITEELQAREERNQTLQQLVEVIVARIDRRDPHAAEHSARVARVTTGIGQSMGIDVATQATAETAARLMNLGKMDIPAEWLTRSAKLNDAERDSIRHSLASSAELLEGIAFTGPVVQTLREAQEFVDGTGPMKLQGEHILITARIIAAANALVGMLSPRAWRAGMGLPQALELLHAAAGKQFDRKVISALDNYVANHGGDEIMTESMTAPDTATRQ